MPFNDAMPTIIAPPPQANIAVLNRSLETLLAVFPAADVEQTRRLLVTSSEESRLYVVTEMLLKGGAGSAPAARARQLEPWQQFRSDEYKMAVKRQL